MLLLWTGIVAWLTWPLAANLATHLPGTAFGGPLDSLLVGWALAHQSRALVTAPLSLPDGSIFYPARRTLFYGEAGFGALPYFMPPFLLTGNPALSLNLVLLSGLVLTAWSLHLVVARLTGSGRAGFVAGAFFVATPWVIWAWLPAAPNYAILQYFPLVMLIAARPAADRRTALCLLALIVAQGLTAVYVAASLLGPLVLLGVVRVACRATRPAGVVLVCTLTGAIVLLCACYSGYALVHLDNPSLGTQTHWHAKPTEPQPAVLGTVARLGPLAIPPAGLLVIAVGVATALWRADGGWAALGRLPWRLGWLWTLVGLVLAIRPRADWRASLLAVPHSLLAHFTPLYEVIRIPERLGLAALMGMAVLTGVAFEECERAVAVGRAGVPRSAAAARAAASGLLVVAVAGMYLTSQGGMFTPWLSVRPLPRPYPIVPTVPPPAPALMQVLGRPGGPLLELPAGVSPWANARAMWRAIFHHRPLLNGYSGYWPAGFPERMALARRLPDADALETLQRATGLELVLVHAAEYGPSPTRAVWADLAARRGDSRLALVARDGEDLLFRVVAPPTGGS